MHEHRYAVADEQREECGKQALERRILRAEEGKHKSRMPEREYPEMDDKKSDQEISLAGLLPFGFPLCHGHFDNIVKADDDVLGPVQDEDGRDAPSEEQHPNQRNGI